jgi:hypothetical protein
MKNWKTTAAGVGLILTGLGIGLSVLSGGEGSLEAALASIVGGVGLLTAADATSE